VIDIARVQFAQNEYRKTPELVDAALYANDPLSSELEFQTLLATEADALVFRGQIMSLRKLGRNDWKLSVKRDTYLIAIGDTITLAYPRFGLNLGKNFIVKGRKVDRGSPFETLTLFGPQ
jgi:hypothetical protein